MAAEKTSSKGQAWFCTTGLPSDIVVEVDDMTFHLHKFPLMAKSKKLHHLITDQEETNTAAASTLQNHEQRQLQLAAGEEDSPVTDSGNNSDAEAESYHISLPDFPGGSDSFEVAAKFCYGVKIDLTAANVVPLRCAGEALEMTEDYSEDNLISRTERFLSQTVFRSIKDSIKALKSCENLKPLAEQLGIVDRCVDAISSKAALMDPSLFGWPVNDGSGPGDSSRPVSRRRSKVGGGRGSVVEPWFEDLSVLCLDLFDRVILAMKEQEISSEVIESCLIHYAKKRFPGINRSNRKPSSSSSAAASSVATSDAEQRDLLEKIVAYLPTQKSLSSSSSSNTSRATTRTLFGLLRTANILTASEECKSALEKKIGMQLEQATLDDLLIPSYSYLNETLYDVDCVERILSYFLEDYSENETAGNNDNAGRSPSLMLVGKLVDGYLSEIASDTNLKPERFCQLALWLPDTARLYDDGLYRAVDVYLKAHPWISEEEREKICGVMDSQKLTLEACTHAAQNERLPLRVVVQVLFFEQLQLRNAIAGTLVAAGIPPDSVGRLSFQGEDELTEAGGGGTPEATPGRALALVPVGEEYRVGEGEGEADGTGAAVTTWKSAVRENQVLRFDMDSMKNRVHELERECSTMRREIAKVRKDPLDDQHAGGWKTSLTRRFGCKFKTQVCDSQESTVVDQRRRGRRNGEGGGNNRAVHHRHRQ